MNDIVLKSEPLMLCNIISKSDAKMFKDLRIGDILIFNTTIKNVGSSRGRFYAIFMYAKNVKTNETVKKSFNEMANILKKFEFKICDEI